MKEPIITLTEAERIVRHGKSLTDLRAALKVFIDSKQPFKIEWAGNNLSSNVLGALRTNDEGFRIWVRQMTIERLQHYIEHEQDLMNKRVRDPSYEPPEDEE